MVSNPAIQHVPRIRVPFLLALTRGEFRAVALY
jgi:hypothetical protein